MESLINLFNSYFTLNNREIDFLRKNSKIKYYPKNNVVLKAGQISKEFYFITKGCLRLYYTSGAEEKNAYFYTENMFVSSFLSFTKQKPADHSIATIEDSELIVFSLASVDKFVDFSHKFGLIAKVVMEEEMATYQKMISSFVTQNAQERYLDFTKDYPTLVQRIPQHQIATFLGVSPETLSRIRRRTSKG